MFSFTNLLLSKSGSCHESRCPHVFLSESVDLDICIFSSFENMRHGGINYHKNNKKKSQLCRIYIQHETSSVWQVARRVVRYCWLSLASFEGLLLRCSSCGYIHQSCICYQLQADREASGGFSDNDHAYCNRSNKIQNNEGSDR